jgi:hypothetical protein
MKYRALWRRAAATNPVGGTDSSLVADLTHALSLYCRPGFVNPSVFEPRPVAYTQAAVDSDALARPAAERVVRAYHRALDDKGKEAAAPSLWDHAAAQHTEFLDALARSDVDAVAAALSRFFCGPLVWGMAPELGPQAPEPAFLGQLIRTTDALVGLANAIGVLPVRSIEQGGPLHKQKVAVETIDTLVDAIERETGLDLSYLNVAGNYGWRFGSRITNVETLRHTYSVLRLRQMQLARDAVVLEIGGGFGCMAALAARAGFIDYTILDLPWVNAIQGYILIRVLGHEAVALYGESRPGLVKIAPFWTISRIQPRSVDAVVNVNSLPEIGLETARHYLNRIAVIIRRLFFSINQEAESLTIHGIRQLRVWDLAKAEPRLELRSRHIAWMEQGYVEEIYCPKGS